MVHNEERNMKYTTHEVELKPGAVITIPEDAHDFCFTGTADELSLCYRTPVPLTPLQQAAERADAQIWSNVHNTFSISIYLHGFKSREEAQAALDSLKAGGGE
jgi:hypothetical protein